MDTQQFEVIRPKCAGLDVHKKSVVAAVCTSDPVTLTASYKTKVFNTWYYVKKKYKLNVDFFAESTESDSAVFRNHVFQIIQSG